MNVSNISISQPLELSSPAGALLSSFAYGAATDGQTGGEAFNGSGSKATHWTASGEGASYATEYFGYVADINTNGVAVAFLQPGPGLLAGGSFALLAGPPNCTPNGVQAISNSGYVVGSCLAISDLGPFGYVFRAVRWDPSSGPVLLALPPANDGVRGALVHTVATDVSETGDVAGYAVYENGSLPLQWGAGGVLAVLDGGTMGQAQAYGINDHGDVVGLVLVQGTDGPAFRAAKWVAGTLTTLAIPDQTSSFERGWRINDDGFVLGYSSYTGGQNALWGPDGSFLGILPNAGWAEDLEGHYVAGYRVLDFDAGTYIGERWTINYSTGPTYTFSGFFPPVDNNGVYNRMKAGAAVAVKFSLGGDRGLDVLGAGSPTSASINCSTSAPIDAVESTVAAGASSLTYDAATGQYTYIWKTEKGWGGTCRQLNLALKDGTIRTALFSFSK